MNWKRPFFILLGIMVGLLLGWRRLVAWALRLPPPRNGVRVVRNNPVAMRDGVVLQADLYHPKQKGAFPTVLIRSSYGRGWDALPMGLGLVFLAQRFAERGYNVVVQTTRGQFDSGGAFVPYIDEQQDGLDTMEWIARQPWFNGELGTWGPSYLGVVQWAMAGRAPDYLKAMVPIITASQVSTLQFPDEAFALETSLRWATSTSGLGGANSPKAGVGFQPRSPQESDIQRGLQHLPLLTADETAVAAPVSFYRTWLQNPPWDDQAGYWARADHQQEVQQTKAAAHLITGWYDIWVRELLADYESLKAGGQMPYLTIGPWPHISGGPLAAGLREGLIWFDAHLQGEREKLRASPVRVYVMGAEEWREMAAWPPPVSETRYYLQPGGQLSPQTARGAGDHGQLPV